MLSRLRVIFDEADSNKDGMLNEVEFCAALQVCDPSLSNDEAFKIFQEAEGEQDGVRNYDNFVDFARLSQSETAAILQTRNRNSRIDSTFGLVNVKPSEERYFGEELKKNAPGSMNAFSMTKTQHFSMELNESRIDSLQRFVSMTVMFHQMGHRVQSFFPRISFGLLGYRMDRSQSIMSIATTASPVSGADVRERMKHLRVVKTVRSAVQVIERAWLTYERNKTKKIMRGCTCGEISRKLGFVPETLCPWHLIDGTGTRTA
jgi:hypothetical protein